jgi:hypothetical protein
MTGPIRNAIGNDLVKVAYANDEAEAELLQGLLRTADVGSVVRRAPGFDVPEFLAPNRVRCSSPRPTFPSRETFCARLTRVSPGHPSRSGADRPSRVLAGVLIAVALVALVVCLATDVLV